MLMQIVAEQESLVGQPTVVEALAPRGCFGAVFEDDGETGYFYALDTSLKENRIQDSVHVYNVASIIDRAAPSKVEVGWSDDAASVVLLINGYAHAVFDFQAKQALCRTGEPPAPGNGQWSRQGHAWSNAALERFA